MVLGLRRLSPGYARLHFFKDRSGVLAVPDEWGLLFGDDGYARDPNVASLRLLTRSPSCWPNMHPSTATAWPS